MSSSSALRPVVMSRLRSAATCWKAFYSGSSSARSAWSPRLVCPKDRSTERNPVHCDRASRLQDVGPGRARGMGADNRAAAPRGALGHHRSGIPACPDGHYRWFLSEALPLRDEQGKIVKWYGVLTPLDGVPRQ